MQIFEYKPMQTIKHALQRSIESKRGTELQDDIPYEERLLKEVTERVNEMKERYGITDRG